MKRFWMFSLGLVVLAICIYGFTVDDSDGVPTPTYTDGDWGYEYNGDGATIVSYSGSYGNIVMPDTVGGRTVLAIGKGGVGESVFDNNNIAGSTITLPSTITHINRYAFINCRGFGGPLVIPDSVISIENGAFTSCRGFTSLTIGNSVTDIGNSAFRNCVGFTGDLFIPSSVETIGVYAFQNCTGLNGNLYASYDVSYGTGAFADCTSLNFPAQFENYDGTVLQSGYVLYNSVPAYSGSTPTKQSTTEYMYTFSGWSPVPSAIGLPMRYIAQFTAIPLYTVVWANWDDTVLETDYYVPEGTVPTYDGPTPTRPNDGEYTYAFIGWLPVPSAITGDTTYTAQYSATPIYIVIWLNWDGTVLETDTDVVQGTVPTYDGAVPLKPSDISCDYTFSGWSPVPSAITSNMTYTALFSYTYIVYTDGVWTYNILTTGTVSVIGYSGSGGIVEIPLDIQDRAVTDVNGALTGNASVTGVLIPSSVTYISPTAFSGTSIGEVLNLSGMQMDGYSYGLNNATVYTEIPGWFYLSDSQYIERVPKTDTVSSLIRIIPLLILLGLIVHIVRRRYMSE